ncbi:MAG: hypothetical protein ACREIA_04875 [Opitutaceae bacterium]
MDTAAKILSVPAWLALVAGASPAALAALPSISESQAEPVIYVGTEQPDKRWHHGAVPQAVSVHRYQAFRANRSLAPEGGSQGWTYNHAPMLAYWDGRFWVNYLSNLEAEHTPPGRRFADAGERLSDRRCDNGGGP